MAETQFFALYESADAAADATHGLHQLGIRDDQMTIMSGIPYRAPIMGHGFFKGKLPLIALGGAILGVILAFVVTALFWILWPLHQGGQPTIPIPPTLIVIFELTMLGTMWATFFGMLILNGFPQMDHPPYDPRITDGYVGISVSVDESQADEVENALRQAGVADLKRERRLPKRPTYNFYKFWGGVVVLGGIATIVLLIFVYDLVRIPFPTNMYNQDSIAYIEGPRLAAPADSVPIQGPVFIAGQVASQPLPASPAVIERGKLLFGLDCQICHGPQGKGNGPVSGFFTPKPADLTSQTVKNLSDEEIFRVITDGFGAMPSIRENLSVADRWSVINYVRTLQQ